ncbi:MAG: universal stress protein [Planctomycetota bacterium]
MTEHAAGEPEKKATKGAGRHYDHVLVSISNPETADQLVKLACRLTDTSTVLHIMSVTTSAPFPDRAEQWRESSQLVMDMTHLANRLGRVAKPMAVTARSIPDAIIGRAKDIDAGLIIMGWFGRVTPIAVRKSRVVNRVLHEADCDTAVLKYRGDITDVNRLILPAGGGVNEARLQFAKSFLWQWPVKTSLVHVMPPDSDRSREEVEERLSRAAEQLGPGSTTRILQDDNVVRGIVNLAEETDLILVGPGREWVFNRFLFGRNADQITNEAPGPVLMFKAREKKLSAWLRGLIKYLAGSITQQ